MKKYKEPVRITKTAKVILESINQRYNWIVKESNGTVCIYGDKPKKEDDGRWHGYSYRCIDLAFKENIFDFLSWKDEEPINIKELLENCEVIGNE